LVAVAIFSVIMMVAVGSLMTIISVNTRTQAIKTTVNNLNYSINVITDALYNIETDADKNPKLYCLNSTGNSVVCNSSDFFQGFAFNFVDDAGVEKYYRIYLASPTELKLGTAVGNTGGDVNILPTDLSVTNDKIFKRGGSGKIPLYSLVISGMYNGKKSSDRVKFNLETSFSRLGI
jgi:hypothetical protein